VKLVKVTLPTPWSSSAVSSVGKCGLYLEGMNLRLEFKRESDSQNQFESKSLSLYSLSALSLYSLSQLSELLKDKI
jgi:hypothetical protein